MKQQSKIKVEWVLFKNNEGISNENFPISPDDINKSGNITMKYNVKKKKIKQE